MAQLVEHLPGKREVVGSKIPPEAAHFSLKREDGLSQVLLCCLSFVLLNYLSTLY